MVAAGYSVPDGFRDKQLQLSNQRTIQIDQSRITKKRQYHEYKRDHSRRKNS